jgi:hypothetical protein
MSVISEALQHELDLSGIGRFLAMTPSNEVNAMAVRELVHMFGRANVYQLPDGNSPSARRRAPAQHLRGRPLFADEMTSEEIENRFERGAVVKKTRLTEEYTWRSFQNRYGASAVSLFLVAGKTSLFVCTADQPVEPKPGHTVIALVEPAAHPAGSVPLAAE